MKNRLLLSAFCLLSLAGFAQKPLWNVDFYSFFDNREYNSEYNFSQTFFGTRLTPEVGLSVGKGQKIMVGTNLFFENGKKQFQEQPEVTAYYQYDAPNFAANAGIFPRERMLGNFPSAFLYDSISIYDPNMSGILLQSQGDYGFAEFAIDWNGYRTNTQRESFLMLSAGRCYFNRLYTGYHFSYFHYARTWNAPDSLHLVDNGLVHLFAGVDLTPANGKDSIYVQAGYLRGAQRIRGTQTCEYPAGLLAELYYRHKKFGIKNTLYVGDRQMNFYKQFGSNLYWGDPYFQSNTYNRTELFWNIVENKKLAIKLSSIHHYDGKVFGWQQVLTLKTKI
jgi:hypothetical protein